ncbi:polymer-forming cytoskeletal protein [Chromohalobacter canadensis]|uniref:polymer-forming cytoskeletal protein n=1 Tax=Chromohalobacter canadensis TaxID=141389 RepID=UPI00241012B3|nr:polymer-forming cytoskeletal protein [Chromohalobacter canadensis]
MKASKQSGFVLVVGMLLLTVASGAVISGMSVNKYQERQAGNYVRTNNYEAGADEAFRRFERESWGEEVKAVVEKRLGGSEKGTIIFPREDDENWLPSGEREKRARERNGEEEQDEDGGDEDIKYAFTRAGIKEVVKLEGDRVKVVFWGEKRLSGYDENDASENNNGRDVLQAVYSINNDEQSGDEQPDGAYQNVLLGCEGVDASGGGVIDSYDSRDGKYGEGGNANKSNATIKSNSQESDIVLGTGKPVYGDVESAGRIIVGNSGTIHGDLKANDDIVINNGGADIQGDISSRGSVEMLNGGSVSGSILANRDVTINGGGAKVGGGISSRGAVTLKGGAVVGNILANRDVAIEGGGAEVGGGINSQGAVTLEGSTVLGSILSKLDVTINGGGAQAAGDVSSQMSVRLPDSGTISGNVVANTEIVTGSWSSRIGGNATAPKVHTTVNKRDVANQVGGTINLVSPDVAEAPEAPEASKVEVEQQSCEAFTSTTTKGATISDLIDALPDASSGSLSIGGGSQTYTLTPNGLQVSSDRNNNSVPNPERYKVSRDVPVDGIFPEPTNVLVLDSFSLGGSANFVVDGGDMTLYVKGDVDIGGGATFSVAEGSSLKIVTEEGRFNLGSNLNVASDSVTDDEGNPILSLYSAYDDEGASGWNAGVNITGASAFKGTIFAPYSTVNVAAGGGLYGAVKGRRVEVSGGAGIHYDEALMESTVGTGGGGDGDGGSGDNGDDNSSASGWSLEGLSYGNAD